LRRVDFSRRGASRTEQALHFLSQRLIDRWLAQDIEIARSIQTGLEESGTDALEAGPVPSAVAIFRRSILPLLSGA